MLRDWVQEMFATEINHVVGTLYDEAFKKAGPSGIIRVRIMFSMAILTCKDRSGTFCERFDDVSALC